MVWGYSRAVLSPRGIALWVHTRKCPSDRNSSPARTRVRVDEIPARDLLKILNSFLVCFFKNLISSSSFSGWLQTVLSGWRVGKWLRNGGKRKAVCPRVKNLCCEGGGFCRCVASAVGRRRRRYSQLYNIGECRRAGIRGTTANIREVKSIDSLCFGRIDERERPGSSRNNGKQTRGKKHWQLVFWSDRWEKHWNT